MLQVLRVNWITIIHASEYEQNLKKKESNNNSFFNTKNIVLFSLILGAILFYYLFYVKKNVGIQNEVVSPELNDIPVVKIPDVVINTTSKPLDLGDNNVVKSSTVLPSKNQQLLSKLNDIKFY